MISCGFTLETPVCLGGLLPPEIVRLSPRVGPGMERNKATNVTNTLVASRSHTLPIDGQGVISMAFVSAHAPLRGQIPSGQR